jgi:hypothetical protein
MADFDVVTVGVDTYKSKASVANFTRTRSIRPRSSSARYLQAHPSCNLTLVERKFCLGGVCCVFEASNASTQISGHNGLRRRRWDLSDLYVLAYWTTKPASCT